MHQHVEPAKTYEDKEFEFRMFYRGLEDRREGRPPSPPGPAATNPTLRDRYYEGYDLERSAPSGHR